MAISQRYLELLSSTGFTRGYEFDSVTSLTEELQYQWKWLIEYWKHKDRDAVNVIDCLMSLAEVGYELVARITGKSFSEVIEEAKELHEKKNAGYSGTSTDSTILNKLKNLFKGVWRENDSWRNFRVCEQFGISTVDGCLVRLCDKYSRFWSVYLNSDNNKVGEAAADTVFDFSAYTLILICLIEER